MRRQLGIDIKIDRPEVAEKIRGISNPYDYSTHRLSIGEFVGRTDAVHALENILSQYTNTTKLRNITISGEKSIGKSSLLNRFKQLLQDHDFAVYEIELSTDKSKPIDEYHFFKDIINAIFERYAPIDNSCLDARQQEIWYNLTTFKLGDESSFMERKIGFATFYSNAIKGIRQELPYDQLERDFQNIIEAILSPDLQHQGLAIIIDELQELHRNPFILNTLRKLSENIFGLIVVGAGLPNGLGDTNFEKFIRTSELIPLERLREIEILDMMFKPIQSKVSLSRFEVQDAFDFRTIENIISRSGGNPLDIKILCAKIFDNFKSNPDIKLLRLDIHVLQDAMNYYASISEKSRRIKNALETCTPEQLESFRKLYFYEGVNFRSIIWHMLAFEQLTEKNENVKKEDIFRELKEIFEFGLFELSGDSKKLSDLETISIVGLSQEHYKFSGDTFDKLYISYFYEELTKRRLIHHNSKSFEDLLCRKLSEEIASAVKERDICIDYINGPAITTLGFDPLQKNYSREEVLNDCSKLQNLTTSGKSNEKNLELIREITEKYDLRFPATIAQSLGLDGYYILSINITIKGKTKIIRNYSP